LLISRDQNLNINHLFEILNQSAVEETEEPEPEAKERTLTVSKSTERLLLNEAGIVVFEVTVFKRAARNSNCTGICDGVV
jgi:hypothetical protein